MPSDAPHLAQQPTLEPSLDEQLAGQLAPIWRWTARLVAFTLILTLAVLKRFAMNVDGISYLDMAYAYMRGNWKIAINSYWGAGYSWLLGIILTAFHTPMRLESSAVQLVNVLIFALALLAFEYFLRGIFQLSGKLPSAVSGKVRFDEWTWWIIGYSLFVVVNVFVTPSTIVTPDLSLEAGVLLASGIILRIAAGKAGALAYIVLGATLGIGYLFKSPMFPLGLAYLAMAWLAAPREHRKGSYVALAAAIFLVISAPYIIAISLSVGRPTIGENARVTYAHYVLGVDDFSYWKGLPAALGTPQHSDATRQLMDAPHVYEFTSATGGTLPPYYNPSYWAAGLKLRLSLSGEIRVLRQSAAELLNLFYYLREYVLVFLIFFFLQENAREFCRRLFAAWPIWLPGLGAIAMYAPLHVELRFLAGFVLLFWAAFSFALEFSRTDFTPRLFRASALALLLLAGYRVVHDPAGPFRDFPRPVQWQVAQWLEQHGLQPSDRVAQMLYHNRDAHYWAHLAKATIVADVPVADEQEFWTSTPERQKQVLETLSKTGAKFLITQSPPPSAPESGWIKIPGTDYAALRLRAR